MPALWWVEMDLVLLMGRATSGSVFWGVCKLSTTLGSLSANGWGCVPVLLVVWSEVSSTGDCRQLRGWVLESRWRLPGEISPINIPWSQEFSDNPTSWT